MSLVAASSRFSAWMTGWMMHWLDQCETALNSGSTQLAVPVRMLPVGGFSCLQDSDRSLAGTQPGAVSRPGSERCGIRGAGRVPAWKQCLDSCLFMVNIVRGACMRIRLGSSECEACFTPCAASCRAP